MSARVLTDVVAERAFQDAKWGEQNHPNGTGLPGSRAQADAMRDICDNRFERGIGTWRDIIHEGIAEAFAETDPSLLRAEVVQVIAVGIAWVEAIDRAEAAK